MASRGGRAIPPFILPPLAGGIEGGGICVPPWPLTSAEWQTQRPHTPTALPQAGFFSWLASPSQENERFLRVLGVSAVS